MSDPGTLRLGPLGRFWRRSASIRRPLTGWTVGALAVVGLVLLPLVSVFSGALTGGGEGWDHLASTVLLTYVLNSIVLLVGVGGLTFLFGVSTAWLVTTVEFPGRRTFDWALMLPLALPTYIIAFAYAGIVDFGGPLHRLSTGLFGITPDPLLKARVMSLPGVAVLMALVLYPYVYIVCRGAFARGSAALLDSARLLGQSSWSTFRRVALPMARPAIAAGLTLVSMEVLNEYGAVQYFGIPTFTTGIFRSWFPLNDPGSALRLAGLLLVFVFVVIGMERAQRGRARYDSDGNGSARVHRVSVRGWRRWGCVAACGIPVLFGFLIPVGQLIGWSISAPSGFLDLEFATLALHSFGLAVVAAGAVVAAALLVVYAVRLSPTRLLKTGGEIAGLGYSIPGAVIAVGILIPFVAFDRLFDGAMERTLGISTGLLLTGTVAALVVAYVVRFLAVALNPIRSGFDTLCGTLDETSRCLGFPPLRTLIRVDIPLLRGILVSAGLMVFVDVLKELPLTLLLRPFNFDTLATRAFQLASDERLAESAIPALLIVLTGLIPVLILTRLSGHDRKQRPSVERSIAPPA